MDLFTVRLKIKNIFLAQVPTETVHLRICCLDTKFRSTSTKFSTKFSTVSKLCVCTKFSTRVHTHVFVTHTACLGHIQQILVVLNYLDLNNLVLQCVYPGIYNTQLCTSQFAYQPRGLGYPMVIPPRPLEN